MGHDYNLPFGPWGMEAEPQMFLEKSSSKEDPQTFLIQMVGSKNIPWTSLKYTYATYVLYAVHMYKYI